MSHASYSKMSMKAKGNIELLDYQLWRMSFRAGQNHIISDNGYCEGYLEIELEGGCFRRRYFILNVDEMKFKYFQDNPKKRHSEVIGVVDVKNITKVSKVTHKPKKANSFVVNTASTKYTLAASNETEVTSWVDALTYAAVSPSKKKALLRKKSENQRSNSLEYLASEEKSFEAQIIGGVVVKTPASSSQPVHTKLTLRRSNSSSSSGIHSGAATTGGIPTLFEGWCWKQGAVMKNWKRRYFRLNAVKLSYYETNIEVKPIRSIISGNIQGVRILPKFCSRKNCLEVETPNRKFYMDPERASDVEKWKAALEDVMQQTGMHIPRTKSI